MGVAHPPAGAPVKPGTLVRDKWNQKVQLWRQIRSNPRTGRWVMVGLDDEMHGHALIIAIPGYHGATINGPCRGAILLQFNGQLRWAWDHSLKVLG